MSDIEDFQRRIVAAMDRVSRGIDALGADNSAETDELRQALEAEKETSAELRAEIDALKAAQSDTEAQIEARTSERVSDLDTQLQKLRRANAQLAEACDALRTANAEGVGEPHLINKSMMAELEAIRAMRQAEMAEADGIIAALTPLLEDAARSGHTEETV